MPMAVLQALLNSHYSYQIGQLSCQLRTAITCLVFKKSLLISTVDMTLFSSGENQAVLRTQRLSCLCAASIFAYILAHA